MIKAMLNLVWAYFILVKKLKGTKYQTIRKYKLFQLCNIEPHSCLKLQNWQFWVSLKYFVNDCGNNVWGQDQSNAEF